MSRHQILYSNEMFFYVKFSKFSIFNSFEEIRIHLHTVFLNIPSMYFSKTALTQRPISQKEYFNNFQILHTASTNFEDSFSGIRSM
jgi:hypothetical protein